MRPVLLLPLLLACKDKADSGAVHDDPAAHACTHRAEAGEAITAAAAPADAPTIEAGEPVTITLVEGSAAYVAINTEEPTLLFLGTGAVLTGLVLDGEEIDLPQASPNEDCPGEIPEHYDLEAGRWQLRLGPSALSELWLMLTEAEGHGH